ncbi:MAG: DUF1566 domain-containing protein [Planctomycetes bacterium]|nr:DUF1566 domain-containing protein [Planctomycetota bacterium]
MWGWSRRRGRRRATTGRGTSSTVRARTTPGRTASTGRGVRRRGCIVGDGDGQITWEGDTLTWQDALKYCDGLVFAGRDDWRLPNIRELLSIVDYGRTDPAIDPVFGALSEWYWSSSTGAWWPGNAWGVGFGYGSATTALRATPSMSGPCVADHDHSVIRVI